MIHRFKSWTPSGCSSLPMAYLLVCFLLFFGVVNGLASQDLIQHTIFRYSSGISMPVRAWYLSTSNPSIYEQFPVLSSLYAAPGSYWYPYGTQIASSSQANFAPYYYRDTGQYNTISVPDSVDDDFVSQLNQHYRNLPPDQQAAITGLSVADVTHSDGTVETLAHFNHKSVGSSQSGGVTTYDVDGNIIVSYPDSNGYAPGNRLMPDGSTVPINYMQNGQYFSEVSVIPSDHSALLYDSTTGQYSLSVPDYTPQLNTIISRIDNIDLRSPDITVSPQVNVTVPAPEVNVTVPAPEVNVTVPAPEVNVNVDADLSDIETSLVGIGSLLEADDHPVNAFTNNLVLSSEDQALVDQYRDWQTNIPLIGSAVDFGLNTLLGKLPVVGTEYVWLDMDIGSPSRRNSKAPSGMFSGAHVRISVEKYRTVLLAARGWLIIAEALLFILKTYRLVREACIA